MRLCRFLNALGLVWTVFMSCLANEKSTEQPDAAAQAQHSTLSDWGAAKRSALDVRVGLRRL